MAQELIPFEIPLNVRLIMSEDQTVIGNNFQSLVNFRYTDTNPRGVGGMTPLNSTAPTNYQIKSGFHFKKDNPAESHNLVYALDSSGLNPVIYHHTASVPSTGTFNSSCVLFTCSDSTGLRMGMFSKAPNGTVAFTDGRDSLIWGGSEYRIGGFINYAPNGDFKKDYTDLVTNTLADTANVAVMSNTSGGDSNVKYLFHFENNVTDSSTGARATTNSGLTFVASTSVGGSTKLDGSFVARASTAAGAQYMRMADTTALDFSGGTFTMNIRFKIDNLDRKRSLFCQQNTGGGSTDRIMFYCSTMGALRFQINDGGSTVLDLSSSDGTQPPVG